MNQGRRTTVGWVFFVFVKSDLHGRAPRNLELYVVGKLLMCSLSESTARIANPRTLGIKKC